MKPHFGVALILTLAVSGCSTDKIRLDAIDEPMRAVMDRHDEYVKADEDLDDLEVETYLGTTKHLRQVLDAARGEKAER